MVENYKMFIFLKPDMSIAPFRVLKKSLWFLFIYLSCLQLTAQQDWFDTTGMHLDTVLYKQLYEAEVLGRSNPSEALKKNLQIKELCLEKGEKRLESIANTSIAVILSHQGLYTQSLEHYFLALDYLQFSKDSLKLGWFYVDVGNIYFQQHLYKKAQRFYQKSFELYEKEGVFYAQATALNNLGLIAIEEGDPDLAFELFFKALALRKKGNKPYLLVHSWQYIGDLFFQQGNMQEAMKYYRKILNIGIVEGNCNKAGATHQGIGEIKLLMGNKTEAMDHFQLAEQNYINESCPKLLAQLYLNLAEIFQAEQKMDSVVLYLNRAYEVSSQQNLFTIEKEALNKLISFSVENKNLEDALKYHQLLYEAMDSNYNVDLQKTILGMESQLEILKYKKNLVEKNMILKNNIFVRNTSLAFGILMLAFLIYLYINFKSRRKTATILYQQKELLLQQKIDNEKQRLEQAQNKIKEKQRDLITKATMLQQKNDTLTAIKTELEYQVGLMKNATEKPIFNKIVATMSGALNHRDYWKEFETHFIEVFPEFLQTLSTKFPLLTSGDLKFCAYQKMNLNTKEVAILTGLSVRSVESRRYRLRQKLGLSTKTNLVSFLHSF